MKIFHLKINRSKNVYTWNLKKFAHQKQSSLKTIKEHTLLGSFSVPGELCIFGEKIDKN